MHFFSGHILRLQKRKFFKYEQKSFSFLTFLLEMFVLSYYINLAQNYYSVIAKNDFAVCMINTIKLTQKYNNGSAVCSHTVAFIKIKMCNC